MNKQTYTLTPGYFVLLDTSSGSGGVHYEREYQQELQINDGLGVAREFRTVKTVDHVELCKRGDAIVACARHLLRKHGSYTSLGYVASSDKLAELETELHKLREEAAAFNRQARLQRCGRRVRVGIVPIEIRIDNEAAAIEIARSIRDTLELLHERLAAHELQKADVMLKTKCKNLERLVPGGILKFSVRDAVTCAKAAVTALRKANRKNAKAEDKDPELDLVAIESAIGMFTDFDAGDGLAEVA